MNKPASTPPPDASEQPADDDAVSPLDRLPDVEPQQPPTRTHERSPNGSPHQGQDQRRNRQV